MVIIESKTVIFNGSRRRIPQDFRKFYPIRTVLLESGFTEYEQICVCDADDKVCIFLDKLFFHKNWKHVVVFLTARYNQEPLPLLVDVIKQIVSSCEDDLTLTGLYFLEKNNKMHKII